MTCEGTLESPRSASALNGIPVEIVSWMPRSQGDIVIDRGIPVKIVCGELFVVDLGWVLLWLEAGCA